MKTTCEIVDAGVCCALLCDVLPCAVQHLTTLQPPMDRLTLPKWRLMRPPNGCRLMASPLRLSTTWCNLYSCYVITFCILYVFSLIRVLDFPSPYRVLPRVSRVAGCRYGGSEGTVRRRRWRGSGLETDCAGVDRLRANVDVEKQCIR